MTIFVLVHGLCHGGWIWGPVARLLRSAGHGVYAPSLTGMGDRAHLLTASCGLHLHTREIANLLDYEDLRDVVLVGAGYGGMVGSGVASLKATRVAHRVYLDAPVPDPGESLLDALPAAGSLLATQRIEEGWRVMPPEPGYWGIEDPTLATWVRARVSAFALATCTESVGAPSATVRQERTFLYGEAGGGYAELALRLMARGGWRVRELVGKGDALLLRPEWVAGELIALTEE
ncbi:MAG: alpha/beta hydrolase [Gemmatimonadales bacterium]